MTARCQIVPLGPQPANPVLQVVAVPFAGGGANGVHGWCAAAPSNCGFHVVELPGRAGARDVERFTSATEAAAEIVDAIVGVATRPFALMGHSMGALLTYLVAQELQRQGQRMPAHLFVSGFRAPHLPDPRPVTATMTDEDFVAELARLGGMLPDVLENEELMSILLPVLRDDFRLVESYVHDACEPLICPITAFAGTEDLEASADQMQSWDQFTRRRFRLQVCDGDHFFIQARGSPAITTIRETLDVLVPKRTPMGAI